MVLLLIVVAGIPLFHGGSTLEYPFIWLSTGEVEPLKSCARVKVLVLGIGADFPHDVEVWGLWS